MHVQGARLKTVRVDCTSTFRLRVQQTPFEKRQKGTTMSYANVIDIFTRQPLEIERGGPWIHVGFGAPKQERLIFDIDPMPKRMIRIAATVPGDCANLVVDAVRETLIQAGKVKVKPDRRRRVAK